MSATNVVAVGGGAPKLSPVRDTASNIFETNYSIWLPNRQLASVKTTRDPLPNKFRKHRARRKPSWIRAMLIGGS